jgi:Caspase domain
MPILSSANNRLKVKGYATDASGVQQVRIGGYTATLSSPNGNRTNFEASLDLSQGQNTFWAEATDSKGNVGKTDFRIEYQKPATPNNSSTANHILAIGISRYKDNSDFKSLNNARKDAEDIVTMLSSRYQFDKSLVKNLYDYEANDENIREAFGSLQSVEGNVLIYFAGHGVTQSGVGFWVVNNKYGGVTRISNSEIKDYIKNFKAKHVFLIADACFSGSLFAAEIPNRNPTPNRLISELDKFDSRWALTSGRTEVVSDGAVGSNSPFAKAILTYLEKNTDREFIASDLVQYVKRQVANNAYQTPVGGVIHGVGDELGEFIFRLK